jgi:hypothetical protein
MEQNGYMVFQWLFDAKTAMITPESAYSAQAVIPPTPAGGQSRNPQERRGILQAKLHALGVPAVPLTPASSQERFERDMRELWQPTNIPPQ